MKKKSKDELFLVEMELEELYLMDQNLAELKEARSKQVAKTLKMMKSMKLTSLIGHRFVGVIQSQASMRFVGGMKAFTKRFGVSEAKKWFKQYKYESVKVTKKER